MDGWLVPSGHEQYPIWGRQTHKEGGVKRSGACSTRQQSHALKQGCPKRAGAVEHAPSNTCFFFTGHFIGIVEVNRSVSG